MPIPLPNLDDRTFSDLVEELRALIPRYAPEWTDHNVSDPGIMLVELFAWLTEALIYRLNRIPKASEARFLELLGASFLPAQPATATLIVEATGLEEALPLVRETPLVASPDQGSQTLSFETIHDLQLTPEKPGSAVIARQTAPVQSEGLGISDGRPHQIFRLAQPFVVLEPEGPFPIVSRVAVDGAAWGFRSDLLESSAADAHFTLEPRLNAVRFGDGYLGRIPAAGAEIVASYRRTAGEAGNLPSGTEFSIDVASDHLDPIIKQAIDSGVSFSIVCETGASEGTDPTGLDQARDQAVDALRARWRAITAEDFEELVLGKELEKLIADTTALKLARARCLPELDLTADDPATPRLGHVSVIVVPCFEDEAGHKQPVQPPPELINDIWKFLDQRRLITCRHHVVGPEYTPVWLDAQVECVSQAVPDGVRDRIWANLETFLHPLRGGNPHAAGDGWPFGRDVYASEVHQIIEGTQGVDHVESLLLYTRNGEGKDKKSGDRIDVAPNRLVNFDSASSHLQVRARR